MTNAEKFENTFGFKPDTEFGILNCPKDHDGSQCPYYEELDGGCHCETWWNEEYKPNPRTVEILDSHRDSPICWGHECDEWDMLNLV